MKRILSSAAILIIITAIIGCEKPEPQAPMLIDPEDGAVFDTLAPTFTWSSDEFADDYVIRIYMGSSTDIQDTLTDTTYAMSESLFETMLNGTYNWAAAAMSEEGELFWSESRSFVVDKPEEPQGLDTTYFPFGMGYEWRFERHDYGHDYWGEEPVEWDKYSTFTVSVIDSFWEGDTICFQLGGGFKDMYNPVKIWQDSIPVKLCPWVCFYDTIPLMIEKDTSFNSNGIAINYNGDTLGMSAYFEPSGNECVGESVLRIKGIGIVSQGYSYGDPGYSHYISDRLLYFYNGQDTVYDASQSEAFRSSAKSCTTRYRTSRQD